MYYIYMNLPDDVSIKIYEYKHNIEFNEVMNEF